MVLGHGSIKVLLHLSQFNAVFVYFSDTSYISS